MAEVDECFYNSFETFEDLESDNILLREARDWARQHNLNWHPSITINDFTYRGAITYEDLMEAICASYDKKPE